MSASLLVSKRCWSFNMVFVFRFPDVGEGISEGEIVSWKVKEEVSFFQAQTLGEIEPDKAFVDIPSPKAGKIVKIYVQEGDKGKVGEPLVSIDEGKKPYAPEQQESVTKEKEQRHTSVGVVGELEEAPDEEPIRNEQTRATSKNKLAVLATPKVRQLAKVGDVDLLNIKGSGREGRILEEDLDNNGATIAQNTQKSSKLKVTRKYDMYGYIDRIPMKGIRKTIAERMVDSIRTSAQVTSMDDADITELVSFRNSQKEDVEKKGIKLTYLPFIIKAAVAALKEHPLLNASIEDEDIIVKKYYNIGVAVDSGDGLLVPVIKGADQKNALDLAKEISSLAEKVRSHKIDIAELKGGSFTITNYGSIGGIYGTPILNPGESGILGIGRIFERVILKEGSVAARHILPLSLTFDHRILDGAEAARFLQTIRKYIENPGALLLV